MNREDFLNATDEISDGRYRFLLVATINNIFNTVESRTCVNCKYSHIDFNEGSTETKVNDCSKVSIVTYNYKDFGCNKWEAQDAVKI